MKQALIICEYKENLLTKTLFEVVKFAEEDVTFITPDAQIDGVLARGDYGVIIPVGEDALSRLGHSGIRKNSGSVLDYSGYKVVPCLHPNYVISNTYLYKRFATDLDEARNVLLGLGDIELQNQVVEVTDFSQLIDLIAYIKETGYVCFDFETVKLTNKVTYDPDFYTTCVSFTFQQGSSYVIPLFHKDSPNSEEFIATCAKELNKEVFGNPDITKVGHNIKFDLHCARSIGITKLEGPFHDTMVIHHLIDENYSQGLKDLVARYYSRFANYESGLSTKDWANVPIEELIKYNALDSDLTFRLYWVFTEMLLKEPELYNLFRNLSAPATKALFRMEVRGMLVDKAYIMDAINKADTLIKTQKDKMLNYEKVKGFIEATRELLTNDLLDKLDEKIIKAREIAKERHEKRLATLCTRLENEKVKEYKTDKAKENSLIRIKDLSREVENLRLSVPSSDQLVKYTTELKKYTSYELLEYEINFDSPAQMHDLLYTPQGFHFPYPESQWGEILKGTGKDVIDLIKDRSGFTTDLLIYRQMVKIYRTYLVAIRDLMDDKHRVHGTFNQHGTKTGRLSSKNPNMQNIITRTKFKQVEEMVGFVKKSFGVPNNHLIMQADLSQAELRLIAHYADETTMLEAYNKGIDLHALTASITLGISIEDFGKILDKERKMHRYNAKSTNFGFVYGMSAEGFKDYARTNYGVTVSLKQARVRRESFFKAYPQLLKYHKLYIQKAKKFGYVRTYFGRKVRLPEIYSTNNTKQGHAERNAINSPIQGTAGEYTVLALVLISLRAPWLEIVNTVHDSVIFYVQKDRIDEATRIITDVMEDMPLMEYFGKEIDSVGMKVDFETSDSSWGELQEL